MKDCYLLLLICVLLLPSCKCKQQYVIQQEPVYLEAKDSVRVEYIERVTIDTVTVEVPVPAQSVVQVVRDSVSFLETDFAESRAWISADGTLGHSLKNKERSIEADVYVPTKEIETDKTEYVYRDVPVKVPYAVEVEKELSAWQKFRLGAFWWLTGAVALCLLWIFRKKILSFL